MLNEDEVAKINALTGQIELAQAVNDLAGRRLAAFDPDNAGLFPPKRKPRKTRGAGGPRPKKIIDPEWLARPDVKQACIESLYRGALMPGEGVQMHHLYFPEDFQRLIPPEGAWICVLRPPPTRIVVPACSFWYALPGAGSPHPRYGYPKHYGRIATPEGEVWVEPREYFIIEDIGDWVGKEEEGVYMRMLDGHAALDEDRLFYVMSRGISRAEAILLMIGQIRTQHFCWFELHPTYARVLGLA